MSMAVYPQSLFDGAQINFLPNKLNKNILIHRLRILPIAFSIFLISSKSLILGKKIEFYFSLPSSLFMHKALTLISLGHLRYLDDGIRFLTINKVIRAFNDDQWIKSQFSDYKISVPKKNLISLGCSHHSIFLSQMLEFLPQVNNLSKVGFVSELIKILSFEKELIFVDHPKSNLTENEINKHIKQGLGVLPNFCFQVQCSEIDGSTRRQIETTSHLIIFWSSALLLHIFFKKPKFITLLKSELLKYHNKGELAQRYLVERLIQIGYVPLDCERHNDELSHLKIKKFVFEGT